MSLDASLKVVLVGDGSVGKTCLLSVYQNKGFPQEYVPTVVDNFTHDVTVDNRSIQLRLWDTAGQEDYDRLRPLSYPSTHVFLVCFSIDNRTSFQNVADKWVPELRHYTVGVPILLVATKTDLRSNPDTIEDLRRQGTTLVDAEEGQAMARQIGANKYVECSALKQLGLTELMEDAVRTQLGAKNPKSGKKNGRGKRLNGCSLL